MLAAILITGCVSPGGGVNGISTSDADTTKGEDGTMTYSTNDETSAAVPADSAVDVASDKYKPQNFNNIKAIWLSQFDMAKIYTDNGRQRAKESFTGHAQKIASNIKKAGFNTVIVQVRPYADSLYPSDYYPMSSIAVGSYGRDADYDPFEIILEAAHAEGLSVQAWINPMRAMLDTEIKSVSDKYPIGQWYADSSKNGKYIVSVSGRWYLNPAYEEVRGLIIDGAKEIMEKYDVDGLHMDDYFYPSGVNESFDSSAYSEYIRSGGKYNLGDWRRDSLNRLVFELYAAVKAYSVDALFGISPAGNYDTTFDKLYADIYQWCGNPGYIDYICPQAYFGFEHQTYDFVKVVTKYQSMIKNNSGVKLIVGMSLGKAYSGYSGTGDQYAGSGKNEWINNRDILYRQLKYTERFDECVGVAYFCYQYFFDPLTGTTTKQTSDERSLLLPLLQTIEWVDNN